MNSLQETLSTQEQQLIQSEFDRLIADYQHSKHRQKIDLIRRAFDFANEAHRGVRRYSGEPYILHPLAVARIACSEIGLGSTSICSALLHDVVEDTDYTIEDIESRFGAKIAQIVAGLTKLSGGIFGEKASSQAENFRKLLLTMSDDIRVILIKMADRLHNMRTLGSLPPGKQFKIAGETLYLYAPLAYRLGLFAFKTELEELSFKYEHPEEYQRLSNKIADTEVVRLALYEQFSSPIKKELDAIGLNYEIKARIKSVYSIWCKMQAKNIPFEEVYDLYAVRIIFTPDRVEEEKLLCWSIYSTISDIYKLHPERTRDWVSSPKSNGYRALHLTVMSEQGSWVEVQIRSRMMDEIAERGFAAHWRYKVGENQTDTELDVWLKTIKEILENPEPNALDFLDTIKLNLFASEIFVFTPKGDLFALATNATVLDFAFAVHSDLGYHCVAAKVNHNLVPLSHTLKSGDQVEILTSQSQEPQEEWMSFVTTAKAKSKLLVSLRRSRRVAIQQGKEMVMAFFEEMAIPYDAQRENQLKQHFSLAKKDDLYCQVAKDELQLTESLKKVFKVKKEQNALVKYLISPFLTTPKSAEPTTPATPANAAVIDRKATYLLMGNSQGCNYLLAPCCTPIAGDEVLGYITDGEEVEVHCRNCPVAMKLKSSYGKRIISVLWDEYIKRPFAATIELSGIDKQGVLNQITQIISTQLGVNIRSIQIDSVDGLFMGRVGVNVGHVNDIKQLCKELKKIKQIKVARRIETDRPI